MIEVEKKFLLDKFTKQQLTQRANFLSEVVFTDTYYDNVEYILTRKDIWLRSRNNKFELKIPLQKSVHGERLVDQYEEVITENQIKQFFKIVNEKELLKALNVRGYHPFASLTTTRQKYQLDQFVIDIDMVDFGNSLYNIGEIELMVNDKTEIEAAIQKIMLFAESNGLKLAPVRGKVVEYLKRKSPSHYKALIDSGVVKDF